MGNSSPRFQTAAIGRLPPAPALDMVEPLVAQRTRFNADRSHRFTLFRSWGDPDDFAACIAINPSGADEAAPDRFVQKMTRIARGVWKVGAYYQLNAYSIRLTESQDLSSVAVPSLPENDDWIRKIVAKARFVVVGWGEAGGPRAPVLNQILRSSCPPDRVFCYKKNASGAPTYPLYQKDIAPLVPYF